MTENFGSYGIEFQEKIMQALLVDRAWAQQMMEVFKPDFFERKYLVYLSNRYFEYWKQYKVFPTFELLVVIIKDELKSGIDAELRVQIIEYLRRIKDNPNSEDLSYVKDKSLDFCKRQGLKTAMLEAIEMIESQRYEPVVDIIKKAVSAGTCESLGHDFFEERDARYVEDYRECVPTGIPELDSKGVFNGGLGKGELGIVIGGTGAGKSHFLVCLGANAIKAGLNVLHYTFELSEHQVSRRYDANICEINADDLTERKADVFSHYDAGTKYGKLRVKYKPTGSATILTIRAHVEALALRGFRPDLIIIDYADIMRSTRQFDSLRHELKQVYEDLRGYSGELGVPIWTASQSNKEGVNSDFIDETNMSEGYAKAFVADIIVTISRKPVERHSGLGRLYVAKSRAGRDGQLYPIKIDTAQSRFVILGEVQSPSQAANEDDKSLKASIREKWNKVRKDADLTLGPNLNETVAKSEESVGKLG